MATETSDDIVDEPERPSTPDWVATAFTDAPPDEPGLPVPRWIGWLFLTFAALLIPWLFVLWMNLPNRDFVRHYRLAWVGFDVFLAFALARTGWLAWRGRDHLQLPAVASATLLIVDAWFDILTAPRAQVAGAVLSAVFIELPLAVLCILIARNTERVRQQRLHWALRLNPKLRQGAAAKDEPTDKVRP